MTGYRAAILDWDGTLADSTRAIVRALNESLAARGHPPAPESRARAVIGLALDRCFLELGAPADECAALARHYCEIHGAAMVRDTRLFPGAREMLRALRGKGVLLALATSKRRGSILPILRSLELEDAWDAVVAGDDVAWGKPHPATAEAALAALGAAARSALVVGDTIYDLEMGRGAGLDTCAVSWGAHAAERQAAAGPTYIAASFNDLLRVLLRRQ